MTMNKKVSVFLGLVFSFVFIVACGMYNKQSGNSKVEAESGEAASGTAVVLETPSFSQKSGNYTDAFNLEISTAAEGAVIYYSTDGSIPDPEAADTNPNIYRYTEAVSIKDRTGAANVLATQENCRLMAQDKYYAPTNAQVAKCTVIRAMAVDADGNRSAVATATYFVGKNLSTRYGVPVCSLVTDPSNLMDDEIGIFVEGNHENYTQHGKAWEREANISYFEPDGTEGFSSGVGIRVRGGYTRQYMQKSFNVYFREDYGMKNLKYELIPGAVNHDGTKTTNKYKNFMLRTGGNDGLLTKMGDVFLQSLVSDRSSLATASYTPCVVYLNGEYWGLYNLMERYSDNWLEEEFGVDKDNVVLIKDGELEEGKEEDIALFDELTALAELDMTKDENYGKFLKTVDVQSYLDYYALEILSSNNDWGLRKNNQLWRVRTPGDKAYEDGKWRWIVHDMDFTFNLYGMDAGDVLQKIIADDAEEEVKDTLFKAVMKNAQFQKDFVNTAMDLLNDSLNYDQNIDDYNALKTVYRELMVEQCKRFGNDWGNDSMGAFDSRVSQFTSYWQNIGTRASGILKKHFSVKNKANVSLSTNTKTACTLKINTLTEDVQNTWSGTYYKEVPVQVEAPEVEGYSFTEWEITGGTTEQKTSAVATVTLTDATVSIRAVYARNDGTTEPPETSQAPDAGVSQAPDANPSQTPDANVSQTPDASVSQAPDTGVSQVPVQTAAPDEQGAGAENGVQTPAKAKIKKLTSPKKHTVKVRIGKIKADGYQIVYAKNKKFTKSKKVRNVKGTTASVKQLKSRKRYYFKVRAFVKNADGKRVYGKYSAVRTIRVK